MPTAAYIGGPAEIAYMAQAQVVYQKLLGRMPAILPRASFTIVEAACRAIARKIWARNWRRFPGAPAFASTHGAKVPAARSGKPFRGGRKSAAQASEELSSPAHAARSHTCRCAGFSGTQNASPISETERQGRTGRKLAHRCPGSVRAHLARLALSTSSFAGAISFAFTVACGIWAGFCG